MTAVFQLSVYTSFLAFTALGVVFFYSDVWFCTGVRSKQNIITVLLGQVAHKSLCDARHKPEKRD